MEKNFQVQLHVFLNGRVENKVIDLSFVHMADIRPPPYLCPPAPHIHKHPQHKHVCACTCTHTHVHKHMGSKPKQNITTTKNIGPDSSPVNIHFLRTSAPLF